MAFTKLSGTAFATSVYDSNSQYAATNLNDGGISAYWASGNTANGQKSEDQVIGFAFAEDVSVRRVKIYLDFWGKEIVFGYGPAASGVKTAFTTVRRIDTRTETTDDAGITIGVGKWLTFDIPLYTKAKTFAVYMDTTAKTGLTPIPTSDYAQVRELEMYSDPTVQTSLTYTKIEYGTPTANGQYNDFGLVGAIADGVLSTGWSGPSAYTAADYVGYVYPGPTKVRKIEAYFYSWGRTIIVGVADAWPTSRNGFTVLRTINVDTTPNDDLGVPWGRLTLNTILLPDDTPRKAVLAIWSDDPSANKLGYGGGSVDRMRAMEVTTYTANDGVPIPVPPNPKPPTVVPVLPFSTVPNVTWVRTEYATPGTFNFTPASDTTLVLAILQAGGAGGRVNADLNGNATPAIGNVAGGDSVVSSDAGVLWTAPGGQSYNDTPDDPWLTNPENWIRTVDSGFRSGSTISVGSQSAPAGGQSYLGGVQGAAWTLASANLNSGFVNGINRLGGTGPEYGTVVLDNFERGANPTDGYVNFGNGVGVRTIQLTFNAVEGQSFSYSYGRNTSAYKGSIQIYVNDVLNTTDTSAWIGGKSGAFTATQTGPHTIRMVFTANAASVPKDVNINALVITGGAYPGATSGASGRLLQGFMLPKPLTIKVGGGGSGISGGQAVPTSANATRGSGGGVGGKGGDGVVIIYEYKSGLAGESPVTPILSNFNLALATEQTGFYRTNYFSTTRNELVNFRHKLRPRTKAVYALIVGAGGGVWLGAGASKTAPPSTKIFTDKVAYEVGSGLCAAGPTGNSSSAGLGGVYIGGSAEPLLTRDGGTGNNGSSSGTATTGIIGGYGNGASSSAYYWSGGGSAAYALVALGEKDFNSDHSVDLTYSGPQFITSTQGASGAVFLFETETVLGPLTSQTVELVLQQNVVGPTQVTQTSQLVLQKNTQPANTQVTQTALLILQRSPKSTGTAVTENVLEIVTPAEPGSARISQNVQSVLVESDPVSQNVTQVMSLVLIKENPTIIQVMDFGVMRYPVKNELYTSLVKTVEGVGEGSTLRIQLEGDLPVGSTLIINGVEANALTWEVKDGDTIQLKSGVMNYFVSSLFLYAYMTRENQVIREHAGYWSILQADLKPKKRATIGVVGKFVGMLISKGGVSKALTTLKKAAQTGVLAPKQTATKAAQQEVKGAVQTVIPAQANAVNSKTQTAIPDSALTVKFANAGMQVAKENAVLTQPQKFVALPTPGSIMWYWNNWVNRGTGSAAHWKQNQKAGVGPTSSKAEVWYRAGSGATIAKADQFWLRGSSIQSSNADQKYVVFKTYDSSMMNTLEYVAAKTRAEKFARVAYVYAPAYVFSPIELVSYITQERDKVVYYSPKWQQTMVHGFAWKTPDWLSPAKDNTAVKGKLDFVSAVPVHINLFGKKDWLTVHMPAVSYRSREFAKLEIGKSSNIAQDWTYRATTATLSPKVEYAARLSNSTLCHVEYRVAKANATLFNMKPILYQAGKNQIDKAKYYMGFTTKEEVNAFIVNFLKPTTKTKLDGFVYRVGTDDTLVCEVRGPNMPIAWMMHGG